MKKNIIIILVFIASAFLPKHLNAQTSLNDTLVGLDLMYYLDKPIDSILAKLPHSYDTLKILPALTVTQGAKIVLIYNPIINQHSYIVSIYPNTRNFITVLNSQSLPFSQAWPLNLLKQEKIGYIEIMGPNGTIINDTSGL